MKKIEYISITLILCFLALSGVRGQEVSWMTWEEAVQKASTDPQPKKLFIDVYTDWCGWCKVMDKKTFTDPEVAAYMNANFNAVKLDYDSSEKLDFFGEKMTARELADQYKVPGLPTILLVSSDSKKSKKMVGYKKPEPFLKGLKSFVP